MNRLLPAALAALLLPLAASAAETQTVVATGYGTTADDAKKAAIRAAVEQVVGSMVDAETLVANDELVRDEILSYSAGLVESAEFVGEPRKTPAGLVEVRILAKVKRTELAAKLPKSEKVVREVSGQSLFAKRVSGRQNLEDSEAVMKKVFDPEKVRACLKADLVPLNDDGAVLDVDPATGEVFADVKVWVDMDAYRKWTTEIVEKIGPMAENREFFSEKNGDVFFWRVQGSRAIYQMAVLTSLKSGKITVFTFSDEKGKRLLKCLDNIPCNYLKSALIDKTGEEIRIDEKCLRREIFSNYGDKTEGIATLYYQGLVGARTLLCIPFVAGRTTLMGGSGSPWRPGIRGVNSTTIRVSFGKIDESDLSDIDKVSVEIVPRSEN